MNPFDFLKGNLQNKVEEMQEKIGGIIAVGSAGGNMVEITLNGEFQVTKVFVNKEVMETQDIVLLQDLILAAHNDASAKLREKLKAEFTGMTSMFLPGMFPKG